MVDRFQQEKLASAQTPVPEPDNSMSQAAQLIAQAADRQRDMIMSTAAGHIARAEGSFNRANAYAHQLGANLLNMGMKANKGTADEERRRINVTLAEISEADLAERTFNDYRKKYAENPGAAVAAFDEEVPTMRQEFQERYGDNQKSLRELLPVHDKHERRTKARLESWAQEAQNKQLESRLNLLPEELSGNIDNLQGTVDEQFDGFQALLDSANSIYKQMYSSAQDLASMDKVKEQRLKLGRKLSRDFLNHLAVQAPQGEAGIGYIDQIGHMVQNAHKMGLPLSADDQKGVTEYLSRVRSTREQKVLLSINTEGDIKVFGVKRYMADVLDASAAGDKERLLSLAAQFKKNNDALDQRIEQISQQPDSNIKKAKILALKKEQTALITEIGMNLNQQRTLDSFERAIESFARAARGEARSIAGMARSNIMFTNYLADREIRQQEKADRLESAAAFEKQLDSFNKGWQGITGKLQSAYSLPAGEAQTKRISEIANEAVPLLNKAVRAGTITRDSYNTYINRLGKQLENASELRTSRPANLFGIEMPWGGGQVQKLKGAEKERALQKARTNFGQLVNSYRSEFDDMGKAYSYLNASAMGKREKSVLTQYLDEKLPLVLESKRYKSLPANQKDRELAGLIRKTIDAYRRGNLK